jgi:HAMP domain-containing protein
MTAPAKELTKSANLPNGGGNSTFTDPNHTARVFFDALGRLGYDKRALLAAAGVDFSNSDDPDARVPCQAIGDMFGYAMRTRPMKNLGMKLAAKTPIGAFPLLDYLIVTCETVAHGINQLSRYFRLNDAPYALEIREDEDPVRVIFHGSRDSLTFEFGVSLVVLHLREETENRLNAACVNFTHRPDDVVEMQQALGCPVLGGENWNGFALSRDAWLLPMRRRDPVLRGVLERHAKEIIARLPSADDVTVEIRRAIMSRFPQGETEIQGVARSLATSTRSLQRRLSAAVPVTRNSSIPHGARRPRVTCKTADFPSAKSHTCWGTPNLLRSTGRSNAGTGSLRRSSAIDELRKEHSLIPPHNRCPCYSRSSQ